MDRSQDQRSHQQQGVQHEYHDDAADQEHEKIRRKVAQILEEKRQIMKQMGREVQSVCLKSASIINYPRI